MPDFVYVRLENGGHASIPARLAESTGLKPLKQSAYNRDGTLRAFKPRIPKGGAVAATTSSAEADASEVQED